MRHGTLLILLLAFALPLGADVLAVADRGGTSIILIEPQTMQVVATVEVGVDPHEIAIGPDPRYAYVSNYGGSYGTSLSVVDLQTREARDISIAPLTGPHGIVSVAGKIWFTAERSQAIGRYDPATDRVDWIGRTWQTGTHMLAVRADGSVAYTANMIQGTASIIPVGSGPQDAAKVNVKVVGGPEGIALSPDGKELWVGSRNFNGISIIDTATEQVIATIVPGTFAYRLTFSPDGRHVFVPRAGEVAVIDATTRTEVRTIDLQSIPISVLIMPDNRTMYVGTVKPNEVLKIDVTTGEIQARVAMTGTPDGLAYSTFSTNQPQSRRKHRAVRH